MLCHVHIYYDVQFKTIYSFFLTATKIQGRMQSFLRSQKLATANLPTIYVTLLLTYFIRAKSKEFQRAQFIKIQTRPRSWFLYHHHLHYF